MNRKDSSQTLPAGQGDHLVKAGDCIASIAAEHGHFWKILWEHPSNEPLRTARQNPNVLNPGDRVSIPPIRPKQVSCRTGQVHRFRRKGVPSLLRLQLLRMGEPRGGAPFRLEEGRRVVEGRLDGSGVLAVYIPPGATRARLTVGEPGEEDVYDLQVGHLPPVDTVRGVKARLVNLGFGCDSPDQELDERTREQLEVFQRREGLDVTGEPDEATRQALVRVHGS